MKDRKRLEHCLPVPAASPESGRAFKYGKNGGLEPVEGQRLIKKRFKEIHRELRKARRFICLQ